MSDTLNVYYCTDPALVVTGSNQAQARRAIAQELGVQVEDLDSIVLTVPELRIPTVALLDEEAAGEFAIEVIAWAEHWDADAALAAELAADALTRQSEPVSPDPEPAEVVPPSEQLAQAADDIDETPTTFICAGSIDEDPEADKFRQEADHLPTTVEKTPVVEDGFTQLDDPYVVPSIRVKPKKKAPARKSTPQPVVEV